MNKSCTIIKMHSVTKLVYSTMKKMSGLVAIDAHKGNFIVYEELMTVSAKYTTEIERNCF